MRKTIVLAGLVASLVLTLVDAASADRLILIPTGDTFGTGGVKAEYAGNADGDGRIYWVNVGIGKFEVEGARYAGYGPDDTDVLSAQAQVTPETMFTPALAVGVRNIGEDAKGLSLSSGGRSIYAVSSKTVPITEGIPGLLEGVRVHGGVGIGGELSGFFFGIEGKIAPLGARALVEYDTEDWNYALAYGIKMLQGKVSWIKGDVYYGGAFTTSF